MSSADDLRTAIERAILTAPGGGTSAWKSAASVMRTLADPEYLRAILDATGTDIREGRVYDSYEEDGYWTISVSSFTGSANKAEVFVVRPGAATKDAGDVSVKNNQGKATT